MTEAGRPRRLALNPGRLLLTAVLGTLFFFTPKAYLGETFPLCLYRILLGRECLGCGATRAAWSVLHLRFSEAYRYNKLVIVIFPLLTGCVINWIRVNKRDPREGPVDPNLSNP